MMLKSMPASVQSRPVSLQKAISSRFRVVVLHSRGGSAQVLVGRFEGSGAEDRSVLGCFVWLGFRAMGAQGGELGFASDRR